jgi:hypothetical protein
MPDTPNSVPQNRPDSVVNSASKQSTGSPQSGPGSGPGQHDAGHIPMSEELDRAKWTLPPVVPVLIAGALVALVVLILGVTMHTKPVAAGSIVKLVTADQNGNTMVGVQVKIENKIEKQLWIKDISSELQAADGNKYPDHVSPSSDLVRYLQAFPVLSEVKAEPLREELKIPAGKSYTGYTVFSYPVNQAAFDGRKGLTIRIEMYDQPTLVLKQP